MPNVLGIDPRALLQDMEAGPAKPANPANEAPSAPQALAALAGLAESDGDSAVCAVPICDPADFEERAALVEFGAGVPREWAEGFARLLCAMPPSAYGSRRWLQVVDDAGRFLDRWGVQAAALGWQTPDVFGVFPEAPEARHDGKGLVPLICGAEVVAITADTARLRVGRSFQTYRRAPLPHSVALWEMVPDAMPSAPGAEGEGHGSPA